MPNFFPIDPADFLPPVTISGIAAKMTRLMSRVGVYSPEPSDYEASDTRLQNEWTLFYLSSDRSMDSLRAMYRYRRPDVCGLEVYDLSDVRSGSWRKPLAGSDHHWSARDAGLWGGGLAALDAALQGFLPPKIETRVEEFRRLLGERDAASADKESLEFETVVQRLNKLWAELNEAERRMVRG